jgi:hypothetical protein
VQSECRYDRSTRDQITSIQSFAVEFDDVTVGVEDVDLRVTRWRFGAKLHLSEVGVWKIAAETFAIEPRYRIAIALYPQGKMNIGKVDPLVAAKRCFRANQDVKLRLPVANLVPNPRMTEALWAVEFLHFQDVSVELPCAFQVVNQWKDDGSGACSWLTSDPGF